MVLAATKSAEGQDPAALENAKPHETADGEKEHITTGKKEKKILPMHGSPSRTLILCEGQDTT